MEKEILEELKKISQALQKKDFPKLIYAKDISSNYNINLNKATQFCKKYGTNFGGYCIESEKFKEILQTKGLEIFG